MTFDAWDTVVRELQAQRDKLDGVLDAGQVIRLSDLIIALQKIYSKETS